MVRPVEIEPAKTTPPKPAETGMPTIVAAVTIELILEPIVKELELAFKSIIHSITLLHFSYLVLNLSFNFINSLSSEFTTLVLNLSWSLKRSGATGNFGYILKLIFK